MMLACKNNRSWGAFVLLASLTIIFSAFELVQAAPKANTIKLWLKPNVISKTTCPVIAWVAYVGRNGSPVIPLSGHLVEFWRIGEALGSDDPCANGNGSDDGCYGTSVTGKFPLGQAFFSIPRPQTGVITIRAFVRTGSDPTQVLISNPISCEAYGDSKQ